MTELVYRYATAETFLSMLSSQELWFSDLRRMNDWDEYAAGFRIASEIVTNNYPEQAEILEEISPEQMNTRFMVLICSFASVGDCLSMWRGYGGNGHGAAIGYDPKMIEIINLGNRYLKKMCPVSGNVRFMPVIYDENDYRTQLDQYIQQILSKPQNISAEDTPAFFAVRTKMLGSALMRLCTLYKNDFFADEREIRGFIEINDRNDPYNLKVRPADFGDTTYHCLSIKPPESSVIREVILGPRCTLTLEHVQDKLEENGLGRVTIKRSRGTYR